MATLHDTLLPLCRKLIGALALFAPAVMAADEPPPFSPPGSFTDLGHFAHEDGATLFRAICQGCHMADAKGAVGAGYYPALAGNQKLASATYPALVVLKGRHGMPPFGDYLTDAQVAEVVNYVRSHFGNQYPDALTQAEVAKLR
ncbi:MAG TPA: cytochrome c [Rudaea sp.]|nr:cytochrome c [Rudaea sp.]